MSKDTGLRAITDHVQDLWQLANFSFHNPRTPKKHGKGDAEGGG